MNKINRLYEDFEQLINKLSKLKNNNLKKKFIISFSGGPDSTFLLYLFHLYLAKNKNIDIYVVNIRHRWENLDKKQEESEIIEQQYCERICKKFNFELFTNDESEKIKIKKSSGMEEINRDFRYLILNKFYDKFDIDYIAIGHNLDDNIENFFIRMCRGAALSGLCGMKEVNDKYIRPLLKIKKHEIQNLLDDLNIEYYIDQFSLNKDVLRNRIRFNIVPELYKIDNRFENNFNKMTTNINHANEALANYIEIEWNKIFDGKNLSININDLLDLKIYCQKEILLKFLIINKIDKKFFNNNILDEILRFLKNNSKQHIIKNINLIKINDQLQIKINL